MAPTKNTRNNIKQNDSAITNNISLPLACKGCTRKTAQIYQNENPDIGMIQKRCKRKAEHSPVKNEKVKRTALDNVTNNANKQLSTAPFDENGKQKKKDNFNQGNKQENVIAKQQSRVPLENQVNIRITTRASSRLLNNTLSKITEEQLNNKSNSSDKSSDSGNSNGNGSGIVTRANSRLQQTNKAKATATATAAFPVIKDDANEEQELKRKPNVVETTKDALIATECKKNVNDENPPLAPGIPLQQQQQKLNVNKPGRRISNEFNEESVYMSALEDISTDGSRLSGNFEAMRRRSSMLHKINEHVIKESVGKDNCVTNDGSNKKLEREIKKEIKQEQQQRPKSPEPPRGVEDFDKSNWDDQFQVSHYARDIFNYLKNREPLYPIIDYMPQQIHLSKWMRSLLVDWMVEVQETFELNHETLYLGVKIVDLYLCKTVIHKEKLQLLGAAALFIACKYDERTPPLIEDFLYICDGAYNSREMILMEMQTLRTIGFDLGVPLSYRFLRRYARCGKVPMVTLTLARYILELSLMDYDTISLSDSKKAAAALFIALRLHGDKCGWNATFEYHSGYALEDFFDVVPILNAGLHRKPKNTIKTIKSKYSHKIFHEVAKVPIMTNDELFNIEMPHHEVLSDDSQYSSTTGVFTEAC